MVALAALLLVSAAVGVTLAVLVGGVASDASQAPAWQQVTGFVIAAAGLALQLSGVVAAVRGNRRLRVWRSPLAVLTPPSASSCPPRSAGGGRSTRTGCHWPGCWPSSWWFSATAWWPTWAWR